MILIQIQLGTVSIISFFLAILTIPPCALSFFLGVHSFSGIKHLQIPACLVGAAHICMALSQLCGLVWPYGIQFLAVNGVCDFLLLGSGLYFLCARLNAVGSLQIENLKIERAFVSLWAISTVANFAFTFFVLAVVLVAKFGMDDETSVPVSEETLYDTVKPVDPEQRFHDLSPKKQSIHSLGSPVDIPVVPNTHPTLSPRLSWPSTIGSIRPAESIGSLESALDVRNITPPEQISSTNRSKQKLNSPRSSHILTPKSPPKSPLKIHLSRSSFSLRRSPSKATQGSQGRSTARRSQSHTSSSIGTVPTLEHVPLGIPVGLSIAHDPGTQKNWVMIPNENSAESRSVSGSSQLTGRVFPASEYNRKINAAGFQRDEPVPVQVQMVAQPQTLSRYDIECLHKKNRMHS